MSRPNNVRHRATANQGEAEARCLTLFGRLIELLDGHAWARDLFDAMLAEAGADDEEIDSERFCGAPRVLSRVARDLMTIPNQKERALSALAALARFDAVDGAAAKELLAALKNKADGPAAVVARVAGLALAALARPPRGRPLCS